MTVVPVEPNLGLHKRDPENRPETLEDVRSNRGQENWGSVQVSLLSRVRLFAAPWTAARQASLSFTISCCWVTSVVSDSVWPHRWQATRLPHPWDPPGKNTGVDCHALLQGNLPDPGGESTSPVGPALQADSLLLSHQGSTWCILMMINLKKKCSFQITGCSKKQPASFVS